MNAPDRSTAVVAAEAGAQQWRAAVVAQRVADPDHSDFYVLAGELVATLRAQSGLCGVLSVQIGGYGTGRNLYDDEGGDPGVRVADAAVSAALLARSLDRSERLANQFWSQLSHIGVHHDADGGS